MNKHCDMCGAEVSCTLHLEPGGTFHVSQPMDVCPDCACKLGFQTLDDIAQELLDDFRRMRD